MNIGLRVQYLVDCCIDSGKSRFPFERDIYAKKAPMKQFQGNILLYNRLLYISTHPTKPYSKRTVF